MKAMRILSFNIWNRVRESPKETERRLEQVGQFIRSLNADVVSLQEVTPEAWEFLRSYLKVSDAEYTPRDVGGAHNEGLPVFRLSSDLEVTAQHSFWLSETPDLPSRFQGAVHPRICSAIQFRHEGRSWWVFNLHLDHRSGLIRHRSLEVLHDRLTEWTSPGDAVVICGDFNMSGQLKSVKQFLQEHDLVDATDSHPRQERKPTYLGWGFFRLAKARIDLCLHSQGLRAIGYQAVDPLWQKRFVSDHRAVVVDLETMTSST